MVETKTSTIYCRCGVRLSISTRGSGDIEVFCPICGKSHGNIIGDRKDIIIYVRE